MMAAPKNDTGLTRERLRELLDYDPETGIFRWKVGRGGTVAGSVAGCIDRGYLRIGIGGGFYMAHRLAFLWMTGALPAEGVDHRNGVKDDNRWINLREATHSENCQNIGGPIATNTHGWLGVRIDRNRWRARIMFGGKKIHLGMFDTPESAHAAYLKAKSALHPFSARIERATP